MTRNEFKNALSARLLTLPMSESTKTLDFYDEMICDRIEDGMSEEEAVAALGDIDNLAKEILSQYNAVVTTDEKSSDSTGQTNRTYLHTESNQNPTTSNTSTKAASKIKTENRILKIIIIILTFPIWISALALIGSLVIGLFSIIWSLVVSLIVVVASLFISGVASIGYGVWLFFSPSPLRALFTLGCGLSIFGISLIIIPLSVKCIRGAAWLSRKIVSPLGKFRKK